LFGGWSVWKWICVRGTGFEARAVLDLAAPSAAVAADEVERLRSPTEEASARLIAAISRAIENASGDARKRAARTLKHVRAGRIPEADPTLGSEVEGVLATYVEAGGAQARAEAVFEACFTEDAARVSNAIREWANSPRFREAVLWQNRHAVITGLDPLLRKRPGTSDSTTRQKERLVANYLQRYCVKNDSIGFFGPIGWGAFDPAKPLAVVPGANLLATRTVYFEHWCIDELARHLMQDSRLKPELVPRRHPSAWLDGRILEHSGGRRTELPTEYASILTACDGIRTAREVASFVLKHHGTMFDDEAEVFDFLDELLRRGLVLWSLEIPTATATPEKYLREALARADEPAFLEARGFLDKLEAARAGLAEAAGSPELLDKAIDHLGRTFTELTGVSSSRNVGETYSGRTLVYEDCRRDLDLRLGAEFMDRLGPPLALVLKSARWYTHEASERYARAFRKLYDQLVQETGSRSVAYARFWPRMPELFPGPSGGGIVDELSTELQRRWEAVLGLDDAVHARRVERSSADLVDEVQKAFAAPRPGWPSARHHCPDILVAARSADAIQRGDYVIVLGEVHTGMNSMSSILFVKEHPDPDALVRARERDLPRPGVAPVWSRRRTRADLYSISRHDLDIETADVRSARPRDQVLLAAALVVEEVDGRLVVRDRERGGVFDLIAVVEQHLIAETLPHFGIVGVREHAPRVTIDGVVVARERWRFASETLTFVREENARKRFSEARRWAKARGMPRFFFVKPQNEVKPLFVDLDSPMFVDSLAKAGRSSPSIVISEMLPDVHDCWLPGSDGHAYASELRIVAVDPVEWTPG
jgi:hypothetical protein